jgi:hypothetical protein
MTMVDRNPPTPGPDAKALFGLGEGRVSRGLERMQLARGARLRFGRVAVLLSVVTWLPLLVLAALEGVAWGGAVQVPLLRDYLPYGQFLIAVPVLVLGELSVGRHLFRAVTELRTSEVLADRDAPVLDAVLAKAIGRWRGSGVNAVLLILTCLVTVVTLWGAKEWLTGGWQVTGDGMTMAGWWYVVVSLPLLRFLALRWLWRLVLWAWVLWRISGLELRPRPAHPDRAGGLAFLGGTQAAFGVFVFAYGVQLSCLIADAARFRDAELTAYRGELITFVVIAVGALLVPLLVFVPKLVRAREEYLLFLSGSAHRGAGDLERRLRSAENGELPTDAISGLTDFGVLYENARLMRPVPMETQHVLGLVLAAVAPFVPLIFLVMPAGEVLRTMARLLI